MVVEVPIEIRVKDSEEIDNKISEIKDAEKSLKTLPTKGRSKSATSQAVPTLETESTGPLFGGKTGTTPTRGRKDPLNIRGPKKVITKRELDKIFQEKLGKAEGILNMFAGRGPGPLGMITNFAARLAPPLAVALTAIGFVETVIDIAFGPGGPFDRRFNEFEERTRKLFSQKEIADKRQGEKTVRITSYYGSRGGENTTFSTLDPLRRGTYAFDRDLNLLSKGVTQ